MGERQLKQKEDEKKREDARSGDKRKRQKALPVILEDGAANSRLARLQAAQQSGAGDVSERLDRHRRVHEVAEILEEERSANDEFKKEEGEIGGDGFKKEEFGGNDVKLEAGADDVDDELKNLRRDLNRQVAREVALLKRKQEDEK